MTARQLIEDLMALTEEEKGLPVFIGNTPLKTTKVKEVTRHKVIKVRRGSLTTTYKKAVRTMGVRFTG